MVHGGLLRFALFAGLVLVLLTVPACGHGFEDHEEGEEDSPPPPSLPGTESNYTQSPPISDGNKGISLAGSKIAAIFILITLCSVSTIAPYFVRFSMDVVAYGTLFGAGLFFSLALMHFIPDADYGFRYLVAGNEEGERYPYAYLLVVGGYVLTQFADMVAHALLLRRNGKDHSHDYLAGLISRAPDGAELEAKASATSSPLLVAPLYQTPSSESAQVMPTASCCMGKLDEESNESSNEEESPVDKPCCKQNETYDLADIRICGEECNNCGNPMCQVMDCCGKKCQCEPGHCRCAKTDAEEPAGTALPGGTIIEAPSALESSDLLHRTGLLELSTLLLAMCFHSVFEGLVIGLGGTSKAVWTVFSSIVIHKGFEGLSLGMATLVSGTKRPLRRMAWYALGFAASTPAGIIIGIILDQTSTGFTAKWIITIVNGLAAGVFIFVSLSHIAPKAYAMRSCTHRWSTPFLRLLAFGLGLLLIALVQLKHD